MPLPAHKTKIVCTLGPASDSPEVMARMLAAGMNVARLNFSHGDFAGHLAVIETLRAAAEASGVRVAIMADLPGPKIRIGDLAVEPVDLVAGAEFTLSAEPCVGEVSRVSVSFERLPEVVSRGDALFLNDGNIELRVLSVAGAEIRCRVVVGGELRSRKGINLPGIDLGMSAFTARDRECLDFAMAQGVDAVSQSFVERAADIEAVRRAARESGRDPFIIAKIERAGALEHFDEILAAADGIMLARGDLGVEIPIERIALVQKELICKANQAGKPVITATQMLESMTTHRRPTRAEATDVANAILDGTDAVMLSGESAMGLFPAESVAMLASIAAVTEPHLIERSERELIRHGDVGSELAPGELIALSVAAAARRSSPATVLVPTLSGATARSIARFRLPTWITALSSLEQSCQDLAFSWGVYPILGDSAPAEWNECARRLVAEQGLGGNLVVLAQGPSPENPGQNHRLDLIELDRQP